MGNFAQNCGNFASCKKVVDNERLFFYTVYGLKYFLQPFFEYSTHML